MKAFVRLDATAAPLRVEHVDTDKILPARFLKTITRHGLGAALFRTLRDDPDFVLNHQPWRSAGILIALDNFGCGSSREHAPWALLDFGFRCIIAPSFADIFYSNCFKNGILPVIQPGEIVERLLTMAEDPAHARMIVDLPAQTIELHDKTVLPFEIDAQRKSDLLAGMDEIARSLELHSEIADYEQRQSRQAPWLGAIPSDLSAV